MLLKSSNMVATELVISIVVLKAAAVTKDIDNKNSSPPIWGTETRKQKRRGKLKYREWARSRWKRRIKCNQDVGSEVEKCCPSASRKLILASATNGNVWKI